MKLNIHSTVYENGIPHTTEAVLPFSDDAGRENQLLNLYPQVTYQTLAGFGGAITGSASYVYSLLDEVGGPNHVNNYCDAPYLFQTGEKQLMKREIQHYLEHFAHYLAPGSVRIGFSRYTDAIEMTAFKNGDTIVVVFLNRTENLLPAYLSIQDQCAPITIAPRSITTGVITDLEV